MSDTTETEEVVNWAPVIRALLLWETPATGPKAHTPGEVWAAAFRVDEGMAAVVYRVTDLIPQKTNHVSVEVLAADGPGEFAKIATAIRSFPRGPASAADHHGVLIRDVAGVWQDEVLEQFDLHLGEGDKGAEVHGPHLSTEERVVTLAGELTDVAFKAASGDPDVQNAALMFAGARAAAMSKAGLPASLAFFATQFAQGEAMLRDLEHHAALRELEAREEMRVIARAERIKAGEELDASDKKDWN